MSKRLAKIINDINNILLPRVCFGCNAHLSRGEHVLCAVCRHELPLTDHNFSEENAVDRIFYGRTPIKKAASFVFFSKNGMVKNLMHHLKYKKQEEIGAFFGDWYGSLLKEENTLKAIDVVVPVPLHPKKEKKRTYNQVSLFAKQIAEHLQADFSTELLIRTKNTKTQTKKDRQLRWENIKDAFQCDTSKNKGYKHLLLVDDVITTGATLEACARTLADLPGVEISVASMAVVE
ncbi:ComF family protein [Flagellimonas meridianipacifica]|uniref:ComF family protein n=1 Tax=Flagellimonas meridianipacifica TaxID=1080225 RepID=A0A2T0MGK6_9FLAO|nr:ComF family protein [Allomuricauda pacifica]PRX56666.1 ComF family protein [Allomuricauda pacifica]